MRVDYDIFINNLNFHKHVMYHSVPRAVCIACYSLIYSYSGAQIYRPSFRETTGYSMYSYFWGGPMRKSTNTIGNNTCFYQVHFQGLGGKCREKVKLLQLSISTTKKQIYKPLTQVQPTFHRYIYIYI
jgi:hypothetical protein